MSSDNAYRRHWVSSPVPFSHFSYFYFQEGKKIRVTDYGRSKNAISLYIFVRSQLIISNSLDRFKADSLAMMIEWKRGPPSDRNGALRCGGNTHVIENECENICVPQFRRLRTEKESRYTVFFSVSFLSNRQRRRHCTFLRFTHTRK